MKYRQHLPQLDGDLFLTDGGIETTLIFHHGLDLPEFAAFDLLKDDQGTSVLRGYYEPYVSLAGLRSRLPRLNVLGGCCGTDHRHVTEICRAWLHGPAPA